MTSPKRIDAVSILGASAPEQAAVVETMASQSYERISAYVRPDQRDWLQAAATVGIRNASISDVLRVAIDAFIELVGEREIDIPTAIIQAAEADIADGFAGKAKVGLPKRHRISSRRRTEPES